MYHTSKPGPLQDSRFEFCVSTAQPPTASCDSCSGVKPERRCATTVWATCQQRRPFAAMWSSERPRTRPSSERDDGSVFWPLSSSQPESLVDPRHRPCLPPRHEHRGDKSTAGFRNPASAFASKLPFWPPFCCWFFYSPDFSQLNAQGFSFSPQSRAPARSNSETGGVFR